MNNKKEKRLIFIQVVVILAIIAIIIRLFSLMVNKGDYYRDLSDNRKVKEVDEIASRGNIYDRDGQILATSVPSFAVKLYKDELMGLKDEKRTELIANLVDILEEDGVNYTEDFNIKLNAFRYKNDKDYFKKKEMPIEEVVDKLIENDLIEDFLLSFYMDDGTEYETLNTAILALKKRGIVIPAYISQKEGKLRVEYKKNYQKKLASIGYSKDDDPIDVVLDSVGEDRSVLSSILQNSHARLLAYRILDENDLLGSLTIESHAIKSDIDLIEKKAKLHKVFKNISMDSKPADDFYEIVKESTIEDVLTSAMVDDKGAYIIPANMLIEKLENKGIYANFETEVITESKDDKNQYSVDLRFKNPQAGTAVDELARLADENDLIKPLLKTEYVKYMAQNVNTRKNIYPNIDITEDDPEDWEYTFTNDKKDFYTHYANKDKANSTKEIVDILMKEDDGKKILAYLKKVSNLDKYNDVEAVGILTIDNTLNRQGNFGYRPINIVYNLDESTVLKIEEKIDTGSGIVVETIPIRSYPNRNLASHVLGYMGPIATNQEVDKYVKERAYLRDEIIGKTGIEESYQDNLKGKNGRSLVTVDSTGNRRETISQTKSEPGDDVYLSIDSKLQKQAEDSLEGVLEALRETGFYESEYGSFTPFKMAPYAESGAVVVTDVKTGEVLALASYPSYDPNLFSTGISSSDWESLQVEDSDGPLAPRPMLNIATQTAVMPGSSFKLVTALAALEKGLDPLAINECHGFMEIGNRRFSCLIYTESGLTHGEENLYGAIRDSCNYYFYTLALGENPEDGDSLTTKLELNDIRLAAEMLGLDEETGIEINIPKEAKGNVPSIGKKVEVTKLMLKDYLVNNLSLFIKEGSKKSRSDYEKDISDVVKFTDNPKDWSRKDIIEFFDERGYDAEIIPDGQRAGLADTVKYTYLNQAVWDITDMLNIVIGQGQNSYTPMQMNRAVATLTNGGYLNKLTLINKIKNHDSGEVLFENVPENERIDIKDTKYLEDIKYGTLLVAQKNAVLNQLPLDIGIKTGTAEVEGLNPDGTDYDTYAWMVGFAPYDNPEISISIVLTQGDTSYNASPIMRDIIARYFDLNVEMIDAEPTAEDIQELGEAAEDE
ncbi:penicillin-binding transpeptidase domain-containing protein [uncultured Anaerococcus sp.]|uniref:penicillin-binding transpeptidase domain-containing protein n=1 Tax=uncultured Anaerococcus sp. TaxID=293428 RepID=UPI0025E40EE5|nr:penicillin-binding transpeptidase domain-containing protein [uncultured Anaerococcus sp.]